MKQYHCLAPRLTIANALHNCCTRRPKIQRNSCQSLTLRLQGSEEKIHEKSDKERWRRAGDANNNM